MASHAAARRGLHAAVALQAYAALYLPEDVDDESVVKGTGGGGGKGQGGGRCKGSGMDKGMGKDNFKGEGQHEQQRQRKRSRPVVRLSPPPLEAPPPPPQLPSSHEIDRQTVAQLPESHETITLSRSMAKLLRYEGRNDLSADENGWVKLLDVAAHLGQDADTILSVAAHSWHKGQASHRFELWQTDDCIWVRATWSKSGGQVITVGSSASSTGGGQSGGQVVEEELDQVELEEEAPFDQWELEEEEQAPASKRPVVPARPLNPGEWICPSCGNLNFAGRETCHFRGCRSNPFKRGDWVCRQCTTHNFRRASTCKVCGCGRANRPYVRYLQGPVLVRLFGGRRSVLHAIFAIEIIIVSIRLSHHDHHPHGRPYRHHHRHGPRSLATCLLHSQAHSFPPTADSERPVCVTRSKSGPGRQSGSDDNFTTWLVYVLL